MDDAGIGGIGGTQRINGGDGDIGGGARGERVTDTRDQERRGRAATADGIDDYIIKDTPGISPIVEGHTAGGEELRIRIRDGR